MHSLVPVTRVHATGRCRFGVGFMGRPKVEIEEVHKRCIGSPSNYKVLSEDLHWRKANSKDVRFLISLGIMNEE